MQMYACIVTCSVTLAYNRNPQLSPSFQHLHALRCFSCFRPMRLSLVFLFVFCLYAGKCSSIIPAPTPSPPFNNSHNKGKTYPQRNLIETNYYNTFQVLIVASGFFSLLCLSLLQLCNHVKYVTFDTNLCTRRKVTTVTLPDCCWSYSSLIILGLLLVVFITYHIRVAVGRIHHLSY